jgi:ATP-binding cassette subfamily B protein
MPPNSGEPQKSSLAMLAGLMSFLAPYKSQFVLAGIALVVAASATLAIPYAFKQMIDLGFGAAGTQSTAHIDLYFLALFGVASVLAVATARCMRMSSRRARNFSRPRKPALYCRA